MLSALESYASDAGLIASSVKLGRWLEQHFGPELMRAQRLRELATEALARGPLAVMVPVGASSGVVSVEAREGDETPPTDHTLYEATGTHDAREALAAVAAMSAGARVDEGATSETPAPASSKRKKRKSAAKSAQQATTSATEEASLTDSGSRWALAEVPKPPMQSRAWMVWIAALLVFGAVVVALMVR
jgi:cell division septation protein DedD